MKRIFSAAPLHTELGLLLFRLVFGGLFAWHGLDAVMHYDEYLSMSQSVIGLGTSLEFNLVVFSQLAGGLLIMLGFLTRLAVIPLFIAMTVAFFIVHRQDPFFKKELAFAYWLFCIVLFIFGSGRYSLDAWLQKRRPS